MVFKGMKMVANNDSYFIINSIIDKNIKEKGMEI